MAIHSEAVKLVEAYPITFFVALLSTVATAFLLFLQNFFKPVGKRDPNARLPPELPGRFLLGSLLDVGRGIQHLEHKWQKSLADYGEMTTVYIGSKTMIFLNSKRVVSEIIAKRSAVTNGRTPMPVSSGIVSRSGRSLLLPPDGWTERRRVMHHLLSGSSLAQYGEWQELESTQMMAEYLMEPDRWYKHHYRYANSLIHRIALGERVAKSSKDLDDLQTVVSKFTTSIGSSMIDWFPDLDRLPLFLQFWRPHWQRLGDWNYEVYMRWWKPVREKIDNGTAPPSFVRDVLLHENTKYDGNDQDAMYVAMQLIEAGSDTTREVLNVFVMAAVCYPDIFRKARLEIDEVCGKNAERLPMLTDMERLPYVFAMIKELLRWRPLFNLIPDHASTSAFDFEGYHFPAGVGFIINAITVCNECDDPHEFKPERWLDGHEMDVTNGLWMFGGGRRICVGYKLAQRSLFLNMARLLYCFDYSSAGEINSTFVNHHTTDEPFPINVTVRSRKHDRLIHDEAMGMNDELQLSSQLLRHTLGLLHGE